MVDLCLHNRETRSFRSALSQVMLTIPAVTPATTCPFGIRLAAAQSQPHDYRKLSLPVSLAARLSAEFVNCTAASGVR
jgi:hypothetical protein